MHQIKVLEQARLQDKDTYYSICSYDESGKTIRVRISTPALKDLRRFGCDLNTITTHAMEWALKEGVTEGDVLVTTETPEFHRFERYLTAIFQMNQ